MAIIGTDTKLCRIPSYQVGTGRWSDDIKERKPCNFWNYGTV